MNNEDWFYVVIGMFGGLIMGFFLWHPSQNDYVSQFEYDQLEKDYNELVKQNEELEKDMTSLILEFYTKEFVFGTAGFKKHRLVFCTLQKHLTGEIPVLSGLICNT